MKTGYPIRINEARKTLHLFDKDLQASCRGDSWDIPIGEFVM
jgi:hypothetical protein